LAYNIHQQLAKNIKAAEIALDWRAGKKLSPEQLHMLQEFSGFGGLKALLYPAGPVQQWVSMGASKEDLSLYGEVMRLHAVIRAKTSEQDYEAILLSLKNSILTAFYTPAVVPQTLYAVLEQRGIAPKTLYEPSAGAGIFISEALRKFPSLQTIKAVEKDQLTGHILQAIASISPVTTKVHIGGFEQTHETEKGNYDLIVSNIPFGNFPVHDPTLPARALTGKIHNYFFAKGLEKIGDGGLLAFVTTDAFLNSPSNEAAREHVFSQSDFISLSVMPDNLMKASSNTEAPSHLLVIQKNSRKRKRSEEEEQLLRTTQLENAFGKFYQNAFIEAHREIIIASEIKSGTNQYGKAHQKVWQEGDMNGIEEKLSGVLSEGFDLRFSHQAFEQCLSPAAVFLPAGQGSKLSFLQPPELRQSSEGLQLGLFESTPSENSNRALAYLTGHDTRSIQRHTARVVSTLTTAENPQHESVVLLTARSHIGNRYLYRLCSNIGEISFPANWINGLALSQAIDDLSERLKGYAHQFRFTGEERFKEAFGFSSNAGTFPNPKSFYKSGTLVIHEGKAGLIKDITPDGSTAGFEPFTDRDKEVAFYRAYMAVRDSYFQLSLAEDGGREAADIRQSLNRNYDAFVGAYGALNQASNKKHILNDALGYITLSSVERKEAEQFVRSDILLRPLAKARQAFTTEDPAEALARCLGEKGSVDMEYIALVMGLPSEQAIKALEPHIYLEPEKMAWQTADQLLSGNVVAKLNKAVAAQEKNLQDAQVRRTVAALEAVQPEKIPFELLDFNLGERWMPLEYYNRFAAHLLEAEVSVNYFASIDTYKAIADRGSAKIYEEFSVRPKSGKTVYGDTLLEHALENTAPFFTYEVSLGDGKSMRVPDNEATQLAHQKIENMREQYTVWLSGLPAEDKKTIETIYNELFNCYVLRQYNGAHLRFPGLDKNMLGIADLYDSQKNAVWRILQNRGALIDHEVGLGKTLTMVAASHEMKRLGIVTKPLIVALKSNISQIADTYRKAYPDAKLLFPSEQDFTPAKRQRLFHAIKNNNWDCILLTHDQFGKIPQSPEIQKQIFQTELEHVEKDLQTLKELGTRVSKSMLKGLEIRKNNLAVKLSEVVKRIEEKKDADISFKALGIDHLFVDEAHKFKNLTFTTRHNRVSGLGNVEGSQKALNMLFALRTLQQQFDSDLCATFLSGTPISNSLTEMYLLFKYLRPAELQRQHIENFDAWASVFARKTTDFEFSVTNELIAKERFRHFIKVPELALFYNEITDYKTARHIRLDKPELEEHLVNIRPTEDQKEFIRNLMAFARTGDGELIGRGRLSPEEDRGRMLIATNYAKKMAVDMRLIDPVRYDDHPGNKISVCAKSVSTIYFSSEGHKGTQIVFCDIGTPKPGEFNVYDALKEKLVNEYNLPAHEISFIHEWSDTRKPELFRKMNSGQIRVLMGSTDKAGTGLNVQQRVIAMHHLDIPWKPSELEQRNGRGARQGNIIAKEYYGNRVQCFIYAVEQSLDTYKFNLLKNKQTFMFPK
jgi:N12 class adenine-specific DNA methylase